MDYSIKKNLTNEQLAAEIAAGDYTFLVQLFERYTPLMLSYANAYKHHFDDIVQECKIALYKAALKFEPAKKVPFSAFAAVCVKNQVISFLRSFNKLSAEGVALFEIEKDYPSPEEQYVLAQEIIDTKKELELILSPFEKTVLTLYLDGNTNSEIAVLTGRQASAISNALSRIKKKLASK